MKLLLLICFSLTLALPLFAAMPIDTTLKIQAPFSSPSWVGVRSMLIPGWGQLYNGKPIKALVVAGGQIAMGYGIYRQNQKYLDNTHSSDQMFHIFQTTHNLDDSLASDDYQRIAYFYKNDRNKLIWWSVGAMFISVYDAFVDAHLRNFDVGTTVGSDGEPRIAITLRW